MTVLKSETLKDCIRIYTDQGLYEFMGISTNIMRAVFTKKEKTEVCSRIIREDVKSLAVSLSVNETDSHIFISNRGIRAVFCKETGSCCWYNPVTNRPIFKEGKKKLTGES